MDPIDEIFISSTLQIKAAGFLEFGHSQSDHRPVWIEVTKDSFLGCKLPQLTSPLARRLRTNDPRIVEKYNKELYNQLDQHGVFHRIHRLLMRFSTPMTNQQITEFEKFDKIRNLAMIRAERKCRNLKMGNIKWSPKLKTARDLI